MEYMDDYILRCHYGGALFDIAKLGYGSDQETIIGIREEGGRAKEIERTVMHLKDQQQPGIFFVTGLIQQGKVGLVPMIFSFAPYPNDLSEIWMNYNEKNGFVDESMELLTKQDRIVFIFYDRTKMPVARVAAKNNLKRQFSEMIKILKTMPSWTDKEFLAAREMVYDQYPTVTDLAARLMMGGGRSPSSYWHRPYEWNPKK